MGLLDVKNFCGVGNAEELRQAVAVPHKLPWRPNRMKGVNGSTSSASLMVVRSGFGCRGSITVVTVARTHLERSPVHYQHRPLTHHGNQPPISLARKPVYTQDKHQSNNNKNNNTMCRWRLFSYPVDFLFQCSVLGHSGTPSLP